MVCFHKQKKVSTSQQLVSSLHAHGDAFHQKTNRIILTTISFEKSDGVIAAELEKRRYCSALKENSSLTMLLPPSAFK